MDAHLGFLVLPGVDRHFAGRGTVRRPFYELYKVLS
jgi:hypothetical protein